MTGWKRNVFLGTLAGLFCLAAVLVALLPATMQLPSVTLGDGRILRVAAVTVGTNHVHSTEPELKRFLRRILPAGLAGRLGPKGIVATREADASVLVIWLEIPPKKGTKPVRYYPDMGRMKVHTDEGENFESHTLLRREVAGDKLLVPIMVRVYPRRAAAFKFEGEVDGNRFTLQIPNPDPYDAVVSALPSGIPVTNTTGSVHVVLRSAAFTNFTWGPGPQMEFEFWEEGVNRTEDFGKWWMASDVTGNRGWRVPTNEPIWMVNVSYFRVSPVPWAKSRVHQFTVTNTFAPLEKVSVDPNTLMGGVALRRVWLGGKGTYTWEEKKIIKVEDPPADGQNKPYHGTFGPNNKSRLEWARAEPWAMVDTPAFDGSKQYLSVFLIDSSGEFSAARRFTHLEWAGLNATIFSFPDLKDGTKKLVPPIKVQVVMQEPGKAMFAIDPDKLPRLIGRME